MTSRSHCSVPPRPSAHHNAHDYKLMEIAAHVVFDVLFSKMRREMYVNERRAKKRALESRVTQYAKQQKRRRKFIFVPHFNTIAIAGGLFSSNTYGTVVGALDPRVIQAASAAGGVVVSAH